MKTILNLSVGLLLLGSSGCNMKIFDTGPSKAAIHECETERNRLSRELTDARNLRDQYRAENDKLKATEKPETVSTPMVSSPADAQIRAARKAADDSAADARLAKENLAGANARVVALEKQIADLQLQTEKLRNSLATESQQRAIAQEKALSAEQALAQAASAKTAQADLQKQLDASIAEKQKLLQEIEALKNK